MDGVVLLRGGAEEEEVKIEKARRRAKVERGIEGEEMGG